ncbi:MAG: hypothetical protein Q9161_006596 [Pseudevernia consocians]
MVQDVGHNHMDLVQTFQKIASGFQGVGHVDLMVIGPTAHATSVKTALEEKKLTVNLTDCIENLASHVSKRDGSGLIAVLGFSGRFPGSESIQAFWESLQLGQDFHCEIPKSRFDLRDYFDASGNGKNTTSTPFGCFLDNPGQFDSRLFNVSPREAIQMDPLQRLILLSTYEALEMAGYGQHSPSTASNRISTYIGQTTDDWKCVNECQGIDIYYIPGVMRAFASGRLNYNFKWGGASYTLDAACASSSTAISLACSALLARNCDTAVAGGGSILAAPQDFAGLSKGGFLSPTGNCKTFQDSADGYCRAEGVGIVVLKRLEDAIAANDNIQGIISGWARTYPAKTASITQPHAEAQAALYRKVLEQACTSPQEVGYVEMHGTGTRIGDSVEMESVASVFGEGRRKDNPLVVGAVKANVGHGEAAAGVTSFIKTMMMLREKTIPPQPGTPFEINQSYPPLSKLNIRIADQRIPFKPPIGGDGRRRLLLNNFDASGGTTCLIIEDPPPPQARKGQDPRSYHIVVCSARTSKSLLGNQRRLYEYIKAHPETKLSDLSYTTTNRRLHHAIRRSYNASTVDDLVQQLDADLSKESALLIEPRKTALSSVFTFTGQGSVYPGMGKKLFETCSRFRDSLFSYQRICDSHSLPQVLDIFTEPNVDLSLKSTVQVQLAITFLEIAIADLLMSWGIRPSLLIGHSLGEYAAMCVSGVLSVTDTLYLVGKRSTLLQERCKSGSYAMLAVGASVEQLQPILSAAQFKSCQIACINSPNKTVVSGPIKNLHDFRDHLQSKGLRMTLLGITYGFHSSQVDTILHDFESSAKALNFAHPAIPVASTLLAGTIVKEKGTFSPAYLARQAREPVDFAGTLQRCTQAGLINADTIWFEVGPEPVNLGLVRDTLQVPPKSLLPVLKSSEHNWKTVSHAVSVAYSSAYTVDWTEYHKEYSNALSLLELPFYAFDLKDYWASYSRERVSNMSLGVEPLADPISDSFIPSTTLQQLQRSTQSEDKISVTFSSALSEPMLLFAIKGHLVDGTALCPASVFCDMAVAAAKYIFSRSNTAKSTPTMVLIDLQITHPLVVSDEDVLQRTVEVDASRIHGSDLVKVSFSSRAACSSSVLEHGSCAVGLGEAAQLRANHRNSSQEAKAKLDSLVASAKTGKQLRLPKLIVYKLFASLVHYNAAYQIMDEVYLDNSHKDAAASIRLTDNRNIGTFACNPYWIDGVIHLSGFILNGDVTKSDDVAYISTGFKELSIFENLQQDTEYSAFSSIQLEDKKGLSSGHVYVFQGQKLVAVCNERVQCKRVTGCPKLAAVASETGYTVEDLKPSVSFADVGVDSLMSIAIVTAVKRMTGVELPGSFFEEHPTVADVTNKFATDETTDSVSTPQSSPYSMPKDDGLEQTSPPSALFERLSSDSAAKNDETLSDPVNIGSLSRKPIQAPFDLSAFSSRCVLVQGRAMSNATPLFLIADGAGSAAAYIHLPPLPSGGKIYALESPFLGDPSKFTCSIEEVAGLYLIALRKAQPKGPYILGGWSAGALYAYEVSRRLLNQGETVLGLILIDMRLGQPMPDGVQPTMERIEETGLLMGLTRAGQAVSTVSKVTKQHFLATVKAQMVYEPIVMDPIRRPNYTCLIWAKKGLMERERFGKEQEPADLEESSRSFGNFREDPNTGIRSWLYAKRTNFGPNGWERLVGDLDIHTIDGDHFSIVTPPHVKVLGQLLRRAMEKSVEERV